MAKRKAARTTGRKAAGSGASRSRAGGKKAAGRKGAAKKAAGARGRTGTRKATASRGSSKGARRTSAGTSKARKAAAPRKSARKTTRRSTVPGGRRTPAKTVVARKAPPNLDRERRRAPDDDLVPTPPSSLDLNRRASAARTGRRELTETSPQLTGGDVDADWESAYSVGDEAPGGDNPTPDQDIVDDIGRAVGVEYQDNEELKGADKVAKRDKHRWELDPASAEDYDDRD